MTTTSVFRRVEEIAGIELSEREDGSVRVCVEESVCAEIPAGASVFDIVKTLADLTSPADEVRFADDESEPANERIDEEDIEEGGDA